MQLSVPTLPFDLTAVATTSGIAQTGAAVPDAGPGAFSDLLSVETRPASESSVPVLGSSVLGTTTARSVTGNETLPLAADASALVPAAQSQLLSRATRASSLAPIALDLLEGREIGSKPVASVSIQSAAAKSEIDGESMSEVADKSHCSEKATGRAHETPVSLTGTTIAMEQNLPSPNLRIDFCEVTRDPVTAEADVELASASTVSATPSTDAKPLDERGARSQFVPAGASRAPQNGSKPTAVPQQPRTNGPYEHLKTTPKVDADSVEVESTSSTTPKVGAASVIAQESRPMATVAARPSVPEASSVFEQPRIAATHQASAETPVNRPRVASGVVEAEAGATLNLSGADPVAMLNADAPAVTNFVRRASDSGLLAPATAPRAPEVSAPSQPVVGIRLTNDAPALECSLSAAVAQVPEVAPAAEISVTPPTPPVTPPTQFSTSENVAMAGISLPDAIADETSSVPSKFLASSRPMRTSGMVRGSGDATPQTRVATSSENFAVPSPNSRDAETVSGKPAPKKYLTGLDQSVANQSTLLGINVAKTSSSMPVSAHPSPSAPAVESPSFAAVPLTFDALARDGEMPPSELTQAARRAVDSAMAVVDHYAKGDQKSVNLQFTVSGVDLAVRVEMRGENVHTTFRTDSAELRNALATEWQAVSATQTGDRLQRLADPVFTSAATNGSASTSDFGSASHQRESGARQQPGAAPEFSGFRNTLRQMTSPAANGMPVPTVRSEASTSSRLNTFA